MEVSVTVMTALAGFNVSSLSARRIGVNWESDSARKEKRLTCEESDVDSVTSRDNAKVE